MTELILGDIRTIKLIHSCVDRGVKLQCELEEKICRNTIEEFSNSRESTDELYIYENSGSGFFRFYLEKSVLVTGVLNSNELTFMYSFFQKTKSQNILGKYFLNFYDCYSDMNGNKLITKENRG